MGITIVRWWLANKLSIELIVFRRKRYRVRRLPELPPYVGATVGRRAPQRVHPILAVEVTEQTHHLLEIRDHPVAGEAHQKTGARRVPDHPRHQDLQLSLTHGQARGHDDDCG